MAYTSGRTVKSGVRKATTVASATRDVRRLVKTHLAELPGITVDSVRTADPATLELRIRTRITYARGTRIVGLVEAARELPGTVYVTSDAYGVTIVRAI